MPLTIDMNSLGQLVVIVGASPHPDSAPGKTYELVLREHPASAIKQILQMLSQQRATRDTRSAALGDSRFATPASPTQHMMDHLLADERWLANGREHRIAKCTPAKGLRPSLDKLDL